MVSGFDHYIPILVMTASEEPHILVLLGRGGCRFSSSSSGLGKVAILFLCFARKAEQILNATYVNNKVDNLLNEGS
jgi:hypothetical protein